MQHKRRRPHAQIRRAETATRPSIQHLTLKANGLNFHVAACGDESDPLLMLLHGFPEFWYGWRHQIEALAEAGFRVVAPDQRGYGESDKPAGVGAYRLDTLADDVLALARALGSDRFLLAGHDWGGIVAWQLAARDPKRVHRVAILNAPHPATLLPYAMTHPLQLVRSAYAGFFQLPWAPEAVLRFGGHAALERALTHSSLPGTFDEHALEMYRSAWSRSGALTSMLNWYRAMPLARTLDERIAVPVRVVWGDADAALESGLAEAALARCNDGDVIHLPEATHWLHHEDPARVNALLVEFLRAA